MPRSISSKQAHNHTDSGAAGKVPRRYAGRMLTAMILAVIFICADQLSKVMAARHLQERAIDLIPGVFSLVYVENTGAAFGILKGMRWVFIVFALVAAAVCLYMAFKELYTGVSPLFPAGLLLIGCGALGNMIDRVFRGIVIDFIYFMPIDFPVFNLADIFVCAGCAIVIIYMFVSGER